jgi:histidine ammonia-lyase
MSVLTSQWAGTFSSADASSSVGSVVDILGELAEDDVEWLLTVGRCRELQPGQVLIEHGLEADGLFVVAQGGLTVVDGAGRTLDTVGPGHVLGEMSFLDARPPSATVIALTTCSVLTVPRATLLAKLALDAGFSARFHRALAVFLTYRLRGRVDDASRAGAPPSALDGNTHLAHARLERLLARLAAPSEARLAASSEVVVTGNDLTIEAIVRVATLGARARLADFALARIARSRDVLDRLAARGEPIYGLNQGLGALRHLPVSADDNRGFQTNILRSHAVGVGEPYRADVVRAVMLARLNGIARGGSGVQSAAAELLLAMLNLRVHPVVPSRGSIGMSDLAPLAHLALPLIGEGEAELDGVALPGAAALAKVGLTPVELSGKDALALCSANSVALGHGALVLAGAVDLLETAELAAALSLEAYGSGLASFDPRVHEIRPHSGQVATVERLRVLLAGSWLWEAKPPAREPISFRSAAQVLGACRDVLGLTRRTVETELNSTGDNPVVLADPDAVVPTANFHSAALSLAMDTLSLALAQATAMATNRVLRLMTPELSGLPHQLTPAPGPNCGLGVLQKTATALQAEIRLQANPASLDYLPVADAVEDHATMATLGVARADAVLGFARSLLAIELLCAAQAIDLRGQPRLGAGTHVVYHAVRARVPFIAADVVLAPKLEALHELVVSRELLHAASAATGLRWGLDLCD